MKIGKRSQRIPESLDSETYLHPSWGIACIRDVQAHIGSSVERVLVDGRKREVRRIIAVNVCDAVDAMSQVAGNMSAAEELVAPERRKDDSVEDCPSRAGVIRL